MFVHGTTTSGGSVKTEGRSYLLDPSDLFDSRSMIPQGNGRVVEIGVINRLILFA